MESFELSFERSTALRRMGYGQAISVVRKRHGLRQADIEGLSARQVRRIENGEATSVEALRLLAEAHGLTLGAYLNELAKALAGEKASAPAHPSSRHAARGQECEIGSDATA